MLFENAFAQSPLCTPSRGCFLTGRYPVTNRLRQNGQNAPADLRPVTKIPADAGYVCGFAGKLHLSACDQRLTFGPEWWKVPAEKWIVPVEPRIADGYTVAHWSHGADQNPYNAYNQWLVGRDRRARRSADGRPGGPSLPAVGTPLGPQVSIGRPTDQTHVAFCTEKAIEFIASHRGPWLFSVNMVEPHPDFDPPAELLQPYLDRLDEIPLSEFDESELANQPSHQQTSYATGKKPSTKGYTARDLCLIKVAYRAMCDLVDVCVGRLLAALERTGQRDNTLVIFHSDHGELLGDHGRTWKGGYLYDSSIRVPLVISWPGHVPANTRATGLVELGDLAPTILDAAGLPRDPVMQARSLWPVLTGAAPGEPIREDVYCEYYNANPDRQKLWLTMVRTARHKLIAIHGTGEGELYDLTADPGECHNLWSDPAAKDLQIELLLRLAARMAWTADPWPRRRGVFSDMVSVQLVETRATCQAKALRGRTASFVGGW